MEKEKLLKTGGIESKNAEKEASLSDNDVELIEAREDVAKGVNSLNEVAEGLGMGNASEEAEDAAKKAGEGFVGVQSSTGNQKIAQNRALPTVEVMIQQTAAAIEAELQKKVEETERMRKSKKYSNSQLNDSVKQIRYLNGLLVTLKSVAKLAEDFVIGLWKQFVRKA